MSSKLILKSFQFVNNSETDNPNRCPTKKKGSSNNKQSNTGKIAKKKERNKFRPTNYEKTKHGMVECGLGPHRRPETLDKKRKIENFKTNLEYFRKELERKKSTQEKQKEINERMINYFQNEKNFVKIRKDTNKDEEDTEDDF